MGTTALCIIFDRSYNRGCYDLTCEIPIQLDREKKWNNVIFYFVGEDDRVGRQYEAHIQSNIKNTKLITIKKHIVNLEYENTPMMKRAWKVTNELEHLINKYNVDEIYAIMYDDRNIKIHPYIEIYAIEEVCRNHRPLIKDGKIYGCSNPSKRDWIGIYYDK